MLVQGKLVTLRAPEMADVELLNKWSNDPEIWRNVNGWHFPFSQRSTEEWVRSRDDGDLTRQVFCIDAPGLGLIGTANLVDIDWKDKRAFHGMLLGDKDLRGKGYALDAIMALNRYGFRELGLNRMHGAVIATNERSIRFFTEKLGFQEEGRQRGWFYRDGAFHDRILLGMTRQEYDENPHVRAYWGST